MVRPSPLVFYLQHRRHYHRARNLKPVAKTHKPTPTTSVTHTHQRPCGTTNVAKSPTIADNHQRNRQHHEREAMRDRQRLELPTDEQPLCFERLPARLPTSRPPTNDQIRTQQAAPQEHTLGTGDAFDETDGHPVKRSHRRRLPRKDGHDTQRQQSPSGNEYRER